MEVWYHPHLWMMLFDHCYARMIIGELDVECLVDCGATLLIWNSWDKPTWMNMFLNLWLDKSFLCMLGLESKYGQG